MKSALNLITSRLSRVVTFVDSKIFHYSSVKESMRHISEDTKITLYRSICGVKIKLLWIYITFCFASLIGSINKPMLLLLRLIGISILWYCIRLTHTLKKSLKKIEDRNLEMQLIRRRSIEFDIYHIIASTLIILPLNKVNGLPIFEIVGTSIMCFMMGMLNNLSLYNFNFVFYILNLLLCARQSNFIELLLTQLFIICVLCCLNFTFLKKHSQFLKEIKQHVKLQGMYSCLLNSTNDSILIVSNDKKLHFKNSKITKDFDINEDNLEQKLKLFTSQSNECNTNLYEYIFNTGIVHSHHKSIIFQLAKLKEFGKPSDYEVKCLQLYYKRRIAVFLKDVTESVELQSAKCEERFQQKVICSISHELLNPVNVIIGSLELISKESPHDSDLIEAIYNNTQLLHHKIRDFIDYGTLCNGTFKAKYTSFKLENFLKLLFKICSSMIAGDKIELRFNVQKVIPNELEMDSDRLMQILLKLVSNSVKHTVEGMVELNVMLMSKSTLLFEVVDTGKGIPDHIINYILTEKRTAEEPNQQSSPNTANIGLLTIRKILEKFESKLKISAQLNKGTKISFELPMYNRPRRRTSSKMIPNGRKVLLNACKEAPSVISNNIKCMTNSPLLKSLKTLCKINNHSQFPPKAASNKQAEEKFITQETMITKFRSRSGINPGKIVLNIEPEEIPDEESHVSLPSQKSPKKEEKVRTVQVCIVDDMKQNRLLLKRLF